jgi:hypothetical protein
MLAFKDLVNVVQHSTCMPTPPAQPTCPATTMEVRDLSGGRSWEVRCPHCLTSLHVEGDRVWGTLAGVDNQLIEFETRGPSAEEVARRVTHKLVTYRDSNYFLDLARPSSVSKDGQRNLIITDMGTGNNDGKIWRVQTELADTNRDLVAPVHGTMIVDGLPSVEVKTAYMGQSFTSIVGVASALADGQKVIALINRLYGVGGVPIPGLQDVPAASVLTTNLGTAGKTQEYKVLASLLDFEKRVDPDGNGVAESNPFDLAERDGYIFVSDAAGNSIVRIDASTGETRLYAVFNKLPNPLHPQIGPPEMDAVPTGLAFGPDGALYVAFLTGFPFPEGAAGVYRLVDKNGDGDALDDGEKTLAVTGLTAAIDVAFDAVGRMYTSEFSLDFNKWGTPGRICKISSGKCAETLAQVLSPTSIEVIGDHVYYSQIFARRVGRVALP